MDYSKVAGVIIGAIIGYGTNWIAIKMLFRPLNPIKIGKFTLPFTPGIIPKRKEKLSKAIGNLVGNTLFTREDINKILLSEDIQDAVVQKVLQKLNTNETIHELCLQIVDNEKYEFAKENLKLTISKQIQNSLISSGIGNLISTEGEKIVKNKIKNSMLRMFVNDETIQSFVNPMAKEVERYIRENGQEKIIPQVDKQIVELENKTLNSIVSGFGEDEFKLIIKKVYLNIIENFVCSILEKIDISTVVEEKINQMDILELEKLLLSVMKKELSAIVNLGALIGFILGLLNLFF